MRIPCWLSVGVLVASAGVAGCGGSTAAPGSQTAAAAHGGALLPLPGERGFVELLVEGGGKSKKPARLVAYFLNNDGSAPPDAAPASVSYTPAEGSPVGLVPKPDARSKGARFESGPGPFVPGRELNGELSASLGGESVKVPVATR